MDRNTEKIGKSATDIGREKVKRKTDNDRESETERKRMRRQINRQ